LQAGTSCYGGRDSLRIGGARTICGVEAKEPQYAQIVFSDSACGTTDEPNAPCGNVREASDVVMDDAVARRRQRVHGEVAALGVAFPVPAESHLGAATKGLDIFAQRRDLERPPGGNSGDGAVLDAGRHRLETRRREPLRHLSRQRGGGDIDISRWIAEERIADCATNHSGLLACTVEHGKELAQRGFGQPCSLEAAPIIPHFV
jgi:hypothetical protein